MQAVSCQTGTPLPGRASRFRRFEFDEIEKQETDGGRTRAACRLLCVSADEICRSDCLVSFPLWPSGSGALPRVPDRLARQCECETPQGTKDQEPRNQEPKNQKRTPKKHTNRALALIDVSKGCGFRLLQRCECEKHDAPCFFWQCASQRGNWVPTNIGCWPLLPSCDLLSLSVAMRGSAGGGACWMDSPNTSVQIGDRLLFQSLPASLRAVVFGQSPPTRGSVAIRSASK